MAHYNFNKDFEDGSQAEREVIELLKKYFSVLDNDISVSDSKEFDIKIVSKNLTFEVKNDLMAEKTGNIAIEFECRGKPSGMSVTTADYWVYKFTGVYYLLETSRLKLELLTNRNFWREVTGGDPGSNTKMYLVKVPAFKTWGIRI